MTDRVAGLGGGVIGASWAALCLAAGKQVAMFDPEPAVAGRVRRHVDRVWPILTELGLATGNRSATQLSEERDALIAAVLRATSPLRRGVTFDEGAPDG